MRILFTLVALILIIIKTGGQSMAGETIRIYDPDTKAYIDSPKVVKTPQAWKNQLTDIQYYVTRQEGTERPFENAYEHNTKKGVYKCAGCGLCLFRSEDKFDSGTGWPSFVRPIDKANVAYTQDFALSEVRTEVHCPRCGGHLGHVFDDGPAPTGKRFCMNSAALVFDEDKK